MRILVAFILGLALFVACVKKEEDKIFAIVNGEAIKGKDILPRVQIDYARTKDPLLKKGLIKMALEEVTTEKIIKKEAKKIGIQPSEIFNFFVKAKEKNLMNDKQFELAKSKYIGELRSRSKIIIFDPPK